MRKLYFPLFLFSGFLVTTQAQAQQGHSTDANAPVNVSDPALRPAEPAQYSSTPARSVGQFYLKNGQPVDAQGQPLPPASTHKSKLPQENPPAQAPANQRKSAAKKSAK